MTRFISMLAKCSKNHYNTFNRLLTIVLLMARKLEKKSTRSSQGQSFSALWMCFLTFVFGYLAASWMDVNQLETWVGGHFKNQAAAQTESVKKVAVEKPTLVQHPKLEFYTLLTSDNGAHINASTKAATEAATVTMQYKAVPDKTTRPSSPMKTVSAQPAPMELAVTAPAPVSAAMPVPVATINSEPSSSGLNKITRALPKLSMSFKEEKSKGRFVIQEGSFRMLTEAQRMRDKLSARGFVVNIVPVTQQATAWYRVMVGPFFSLQQAQQAQVSIANREHITGMIRKIDG